eukprot:CAMPEP_0172086912 /NCGR_PEP_ID=MMETSP1043-20130122/22395_1 /TAXON_ID=464988 /ORGANISM="Hemiselmis andersenii, Strain CCMP441" /LENGTH=62 /DNA_ID=CAMNT_0012749065 /DNA_START=1 /DNA_END=187 /DNA_ORIENTATION=+
MVQGGRQKGGAEVEMDTERDKGAVQKIIEDLKRSERPDTSSFDATARADARREKKKIQERNR